MRKRIIFLSFFILICSINLFGFSFGSDDSSKCKCLPDITKIAKEVMPSVVNINTTKIIKRANPFYH